MKKNILIISAPSGGGKTIVSNYILSTFPEFSFSISATTRIKRDGEIDGQHYYFISDLEFLNKKITNEFIECEEIFGYFYGTQLSEINRILTNKQYPLFDIDVKGAYAIQQHYPDNSLLIFLKPPSLDVLKERLSKRNTETDKQIKKRLERAELEISMSNKFDYVLINDKLDSLLHLVHNIIEDRFVLRKT